jgi:hypothetical protein
MAKVKGCSRTVVPSLAVANGEHLASHITAPFSDSSAIGSASTTTAAANFIADLVSSEVINSAHEHKGLSLGGFEALVLGLAQINRGSGKMVPLSVSRSHLDIGIVTAGAVLGGSVLASKSTSKATTKAASTATSKSASKSTMTKLRVEERRKLKSWVRMRMGMGMSRSMMMTKGTMVREPSRDLRCGCWGWRGRDGQANDLSRLGSQKVLELVLLGQGDRVTILVGPLEIPDAVVSEAEELTAFLAKLVEGSITLENDTTDLVFASTSGQAYLKGS